MKAAHSNKALGGSRQTKLVDPDACQSETARQHELVTITALSEDGAAIGRIDRLPAHSVVLDGSLIAGLDLHVGDRLIVRARRPDRFGFKGHGSQQWTATAIVEKESQ